MDAGIDNNANTKTCTRCKRTQALTEFSKHKSCRGGRTTHCKTCVREMARVQWAKSPEKYSGRVMVHRRLRRKYGMGIEEFERRVAAQGGLCAICGVTLELTGCGTPRRACVDHDHTTGRIRSILCNNCNRGLGCFADKPEILRKAAEYVERNSKLKD